MIPMLPNRPQKPFQPPRVTPVRRVLQEQNRFGRVSSSSLPYSGSQMQQYHVPETQESSLENVPLLSDPLEINGDLTNPSTSQSVSISVLEKMFHHSDSNIENMLKTLESKIVAKCDAVDERLNNIEEEQSRQQQILNALVIAQSKTVHGGASLSIETNAEILTVAKYVSFPLKVRATAHVIARFVATTINPASHNLEYAFAVFDLLLHAPISKNRKEIRRSKFGQTFRNMRTLLAQAYLRNAVEVANEMEQDRISGFSEQHGSSGVAITRRRGGKDSSEEYITGCPRWAKKGFLLPEHMANWISSHHGEPAVHVDIEAEDENYNERDPFGERPTKRQKVNSTRRKNDAEIRRNVSKKIWTLGTQFLNLSRHEGRRFFTRYMAFLFHDLEGCKWDFVLPTGYFGRVDEVELSTTYLGIEKEVVEDINRQNAAKWTNLKTAFPGLEVEVEYNARVYSNDEARKRGSDKFESVTIRRKICIWNAALRFLMHYCRVSQEEDILRYAGYSLKAVYFIAIGFGTMLHESCEELKVSGKREDMLEQGYPKDLMIDGEKTRTSLMRNHTVDITKRHYDMLAQREMPVADERRFLGLINVDASTMCEEDVDAPIMPAAALGARS